MCELTVTLSLARNAEFHPACERARLICALSQSRAITADRITLIERLGFTVKITNDRRQKPRERRT